MKKLILLAAAALALTNAACGGSPGCNTSACSSPSTQTYQTCATSGSNSVLTENYGGSTCQIDTNNPSSQESTACQQAIDAWCGGTTGNDGGS